MLNIQPIHRDRPNRRPGVASIAAILLAIGLLGPLSRPAPADAAQNNDDRPNIVVIMLDDLGYSDFGCYGANIIETPTIDRLAEDGLRFSQFYNTGKCHSSRISLLTGLYPYQAGNRNIRHGATIAEVLGQVGYFTTMAGKWHLNATPTEYGFDRYFGHLSGACDFFNGLWGGNSGKKGGKNTWRLNGEKFDDFGVDFYTTIDETDYALRFIDEALSKDKPFFTYVVYNAPHYPLQAPKADIMKYRGKFKGVGWDKLRRMRYQKQLEMGLIPSKWDLSPRPGYIPAWNSLTAEQKDFEDLRMATYAAMVDVVDQNIQRIVAHLKERGEWENTLLLLCSDNGGCPIERTANFPELMPWEADSFLTFDPAWANVNNTPFRWYKQNQHEGGIASPLVVSWPAGLKTEPGAITRQPGHLIDIMPTLLDAAGVNYNPRKVDSRAEDPREIEGRSLVPILKGKQREGHDWMYFAFGNNRAMRVGPWKLVSARGSRWELYNMQEDRTELNNLAGEMPALTHTLKTFWRTVSAEVDHTPRGRRRPVRDRAPQMPDNWITDR